MALTDRLDRMSRRIAAVVAAAAVAALAGTAPVPARAADPIPVQQISSDALTDPDAQHATQAEPDTFAVGDTVVSAFQVGRFFDGGADGIGFSTSLNGGLRWTPALLPQFTHN